MDYSSGEMGPSTLHYSFEKAKVEDFAVNGTQTVAQPKVNEKLVEHYLDLCERHPTWTFGQLPVGYTLTLRHFVKLRAQHIVSCVQLKYAKIK